LRSRSGFFIEDFSDKLSGGSEAVEAAEIADSAPHVSLDHAFRHSAQQAKLKGFTG
jgi:hypothetical protein